MPVSTPDPLPRLYMLHDIALEAQRLSAILPPDNLDHRRPGLERQPSGVFKLVSSSSMGETKWDPLIPTIKTREVGREAGSWKTCACRWVRWCFGARLDLDEG